MTIYIRKQNNEDLAELEVYELDDFISIIPYINIRIYSELLLKEKNKEKFIEALALINSTPSYFVDEDLKDSDDLLPSKNYDQVVSSLIQRLKILVEEFNGLYLVED